MTVRLKGRARRRARRALGGFTVLLGGLWIAALVPTLCAGTVLQAVLLTVVFLAIWVPSTLWMANLTAGNTHIGPDGLRLRGILTRSFIGWDQIAEIKDRFHQGRRGGWWTVEAHLTNGRVRRLPGFYGEGPTPDKYSRPKRDADFETQLFELRNAASPRI